MAKPELGTKRVCPETGRKFYDLNKDPVVSPYTGKIVPVETALARTRTDTAVTASRAPTAADESAVAEPAEAEFVSLEEADAEASGATKKPAQSTESDIEDEDVEIGENLDDDTFIEEQEDEDDADVTDIIGSDIENEEES